MTANYSLCMHIFVTMFCVKIPKCSIPLVFHCCLNIFVYFYFIRMPRKQNSYYGHRNAKYRNKVTQKDPQTTSVPFGPETPNIENHNPFANTHTTLSQKNPETSSLPFGSQAPNVQNQNLFANTQSTLSACNAAMLDFSAQTVLPIEGNLPFFFIVCFKTLELLNICKIPHLTDSLYLLVT